MTKREFLNKLAYELGNMDDNAKAEILNDFSEHFDIAEKSGKTEEETSGILGDPREIAAEFTRDYSGRPDDDFRPHVFASQIRPGGHVSHKGTQRDAKEQYEGYEPNRKGRKKDFDFDIDIDLGNIGETVNNALNKVRETLENIPFLQNKGWKSRERGNAPQDGHRFMEQVSSSGVNKIVVSLLNSDIEISGHNSDAIAVDCGSRRYFATVLDTEEGVFTISERSNNGTDVSLAIPADFGGIVQIVTRSGDIEAEGFKANKITVKTASGDVEMSGAGADGGLSIGTGSGDIELRGCFAGEGLNLATGNGDVETDKCEGRLKVGTGSGDVCVENHSGTVRAGTGSGSIEISTDEMSGDISYSTGSGEIAIACNRFNGSVRMASGSGDISFQTREVNGDITARTSSGDIEIGLADGNDVKFQLTKRGRSSDINNNYESKNGENARFTVKCETNSGDIDIKRIR